MSVSLKPGIIALVPVGELEPDPNQPRGEFDKDRLAALGDSMLIRIEHPLQIRVDGKRKLIYDGECRWRAAKLKKIAKVPCLLREGVDDPIARAAGQLATSQYRMPLNVMEIAAFLVNLQKREKKSPNDLLAAMSKMGMQNVAGTKLDKLMRLTELPAWLQDMIRRGDLSTSHGEAALPLLGSHVAGSLFKSLKQSIENALDWRGAMTVKEMQEAVQHAFVDYGVDLDKGKYDSSGERVDVRAFAIDVCLKCDFYKKVGNRQICMNPPEFHKKNETALQLKAQQEAEKAVRAAQRAKKPGARDNPDPAQVEPRELKASRGGFVVMKQLRRNYFEPLADARFDTEGCKACPHRKLGSEDGKTGDQEICIHPPCFNQKTEQDKRYLSRKQKTREYLEAWLRPIVIHEAPLRLDENRTYGLMMWLATGCVDQFSKWHSGQMHQRAADITAEHILKPWKLTDLPSFLKFAETGLEQQHWKQMVQSAVRIMTREQLRWFAQHIDIHLDAEQTRFRIDADYLRLKRKADLEGLARLASMETIKGLGVSELKAALLDPERINRIGVPADIESIYREPFDEHDERDDIEFDEDEEEDAEELDGDDKENFARATDSIAEAIGNVIEKPKRGRK